MERKKALYKLLVGDLNNTEYLFALDAKEVVNILNKKGYDYTVEELVEFIEELKKKMEDSSEINTALLDNITGGICADQSNQELVLLTLRVKAAIEKCIWKCAV